MHPKRKYISIKYELKILCAINIPNEIKLLLLLNTIHFAIQILSRISIVDKGCMFMEMHRYGLLH